MNWYIMAMKKYAVFTGRSRRREYWTFSLINFLITCALLGVDWILALASGGGVAGVFSSLYSLGVILPSLAILVRRLHDTGRSGWWFFFCFIPLVGIIVLLIFLFLDGETGENRYGPNPKAAPAVA